MALKGSGKDKKDKKKKKDSRRPQVKSQGVTGGLSKRRINRKAGMSARLIVDKGESKAIQFLFPPDDETGFKEYETHSWREKGKWNFVPCLGECPLCEDDDDEVRKTSYRFCTNVYSKKDKAVKVFEGGTEIAGKILFRWERKKSAFLNKMFDIAKTTNGDRISWDIDTSDSKPLKSTDGLELHDLDAFINGGWERYFQEDAPGTESDSKKKKSAGKKKTALDDDDEDAQDDQFSKDELMETEWVALKKIATNLKIKLVDSEGAKRKRPMLVKLILKKQG